MLTRAAHKRLWLLTLLLLIGFALRLHNLTVANLDIDETWSYVNSFYLAYPSGYTAVQILAPEPNNALHLFLLSLFLRLLPGAFAARWLSVVVGVLTIPLAARIGFRLYGRRAALISALIVALAYAPVTFSQIARPYALATMLALLSLLFWLEKRARLNMLASALVPLAHVGAIPVVFAQDALTLWGILRGARVRKLDWIIRRVPVYAMLLLLVYAAYVRLDVHVISSGQTAPTPTDLLDHALSVINGGFAPLTAGGVLFLLGVVLPLIGLALLNRRKLPVNLRLPLLWIALTYAMLIAGAVFSNGPIKWLHISHVAVALALLMAGILAQAKRRIVYAVLLAYCLASAASLLSFYVHPSLYWSDVRAEVESVRQADEPLYLQQPTILWSLQVNNPDAPYINQLPALADRPARYLYLEMDGWMPAAPSECNPEPLWVNSSGLRLLDCHLE